MMYLSKEHIYTIMLVGLWNSDAFLTYIEKQVREFTRGVSTRMLQKDTFYNTPLASDKGDTTRNDNKSFHRANPDIFGKGQAGSLCHQLRVRS